MKTDVKLQESFSYAKWPWIVLFAIGISIILAIVIIYFVKKIKAKEKKEVIPEIIKPKDINAVKFKYLAQLDKISRDVNAELIDIRTAYLNISECIRGFIEEATGINAKSFTLLDARKLHMSVLEKLLEEYYIPEFAYKSAGDINKSIYNTGEAIKAWN